MSVQGSNRLLCVLILVSAILMSGPSVFAAEPAATAPASGEVSAVALPVVPKFEFFINMGPAQQSGYLTTEDSMNSALYGFRILGATGIFSVEFGDFTVRHDTNEFGLANNYDVRVSTFALVPMVRFFDRPRFQIAVGAAPMLVTLRQASPDNEITHGTFVFAGLARYELNDNWAAHFSSRWFNVEQRFNRSTTTFEVWQNTVGLAYSWSKN